jgi:hypothetical protein
MHGYRRWHSGVLDHPFPVILCDAVEPELLLLDQGPKFRRIVAAGEHGLHNNLHMLPVLLHVAVHCLFERGQLIIEQDRRAVHTWIGQELDTS